MGVARGKTSRRDKNKRTIWETRQGRAMIGRHVQITWPSDNTVYTALIVDFYPDTNQHKVLYDSDESIEVLELGDGPNQRSWTRARELEGVPLVGKRIILFDHDEVPGDEWFDFMRDESQTPEEKFQVIVLQRITNVVKDDVVGPMASGKHAFYRVLNVLNDYLALIDLAATDYELVPSEPDPEPQPEPEAEPQPVVSSPSPGPQPAEAEDEPQEYAKGEEEYYPEKDMDQGEGSDAEVMPSPSGRRRQLSADPHPVQPRKNARVAPDPDPVEDDVVDIDLYKVAKVVSADRVVEADQPFGSTPAVDVDIDQDDLLASPIKGHIDYGGSQETHDAPIERSGSKGKRRPPPKPSPFPELDFDENGQDTASDNEGDGLKSKSRKVQCQVGDFIVLDSGIGGPPRKAYVEAHLPETDTHFVAFCDRRGGNLQIKLTPDNHKVLNENEGKQLARKKQDTFDDDVAMLSDDAPQPKPKRLQKRKAKVPATKQRKRGSRRIGSPEVKGQSANQDICGRCISIVWPKENLVYVALVLGYSSFSLQHQIVYMVDHCIETLNLKYREWTLLPREKEPWMDNGLVGKRLYVFWPGEYDDESSQVLARQAFGDDTKVPYEAYVLSYVGEGKYKIIYPATEDTEIRVLRATEDEEASALEKEWDLLDEGVNEIEGLPIIGWTD
ncbi:EMSY-LIKE protein [Gracilaria domingensis]|nr:EMSY-LIKE protein [Gracilaria domingensis]